mmetsp:Transcript_44383/g.105116  ORF Transcript_44383/g.105116 Transcript_44383/m.105116 type:complete len:210 (+) Transcript_44383:740-1369(+)
MISTMVPSRHTSRFNWCEANTSACCMFTRIHFCSSFAARSTSYQGLLSLKGGAAKSSLMACPLDCPPSALLPSASSPVPPVAASASHLIRLSIASESASICCCNRHRSSSGFIIWSSYARMGARTSSASAMCASAINGPVSMPAAAATAATSAATSASRTPGGTPVGEVRGTGAAGAGTGDDLGGPLPPPPNSRKRFTASSRLPLAISR